MKATDVTVSSRYDERSDVVIYTATSCGSIFEIRIPCSMYKAPDHVWQAFLDAEIQREVFAN